MLPQPLSKVKENKFGRSEGGERGGCWWSVGLLVLACKSLKSNFGKEKARVLGGLEKVPIIA